MTPTLDQRALIWASRTAGVAMGTIALCLTACGGPAGGPQGEGSPTAPASQAVGSATSQDINVQDRASLQPGGRLRLATPGFATNWNPQHIDGNNADTATIRGAFLPGGMQTDAAGAISVDPNYLVSAEMTQQTPTVVEVTLNPEATWNDGKQITTDDWVATIEACGTSEAAMANSCTTREGNDQVASITPTADKLGMSITFKDSYPDWTRVLFSVQRAESVNTSEIFNTGWDDITKNPGWYSGPFKVSTFDLTQKVLTLVPNENWWGERPLLDEIVWRTVASDATAAAYANDEIDSFDIGPDADAYQRAINVAGGAVRRAAGPDWRHLTINQAAGLLTDKVIRQAIVRGLNRGEIARSDLAGLDWPAAPKNNHIFNANQEGYVDSAVATGLDYDPERAKADLEAAGWVDSDGDGIREKDGKRLAITFTQIGGVSVSENEGKQVQAQLESIGMQVDLVTVTADEFQEGPLLSDRKFETIAFSWRGSSFPFGSIKQIYGTGSTSNFSNTSLPEVDELANQVAVEVDRTERIRLSNEADKLLWEDVNTLPLYQRPELVASKAKLANYGAFGLGSTTWQNVGYAP